MKHKHKATVETLVNTVAIALTAFGVTQIIASNYYGFVVILFAMVLEYYKYWGRDRGLW